MTICAEVDEDELLCTDELSEDEMLSIDELYEDELTSRIELDEDEPTSETTELDMEELIAGANELEDILLIMLLVAAEVLAALLEELIALELELLDPPPLLPPHAVSARLTIKSGSIFWTRIGKLRYFYEDVVVNYTIRAIGLYIIFLDRSVRIYLAVFEHKWI